ncbi:helix-turn-helix domain-containing protein [Limibacter armeniacum]|uniref:helix-turn-helix domain-containing protein n=1 Tax=Limibacter armeniacum TaxID=466084 RepID=UPI002FE5C354
MQLTLAHRKQIERLLTEGKSQSAIALVLGVHRSTVSREISRNTCPMRKVYTAEYAERIKRGRRHYANALRKGNSWVASSLCWRYLGRFGARGAYLHSRLHMRLFPPYELTFNFSPRNNHYLPTYRYRPNRRRSFCYDWLHADILQYVRNHRNYWRRKWLAPCKGMISQPTVAVEQPLPTPIAITSAPPVYPTLQPVAPQVNGITMPSRQKMVA